MKKIIFLFICICASINNSGQNETAKWYFGANAALDFMTNPPTVLNNSAMDKYQGSSTIADAAGNLLFYTDGNNVWNKQHVIMANGTLPLSMGSNQARAMIVKQPGNSNLYYIFRFYIAGCYTTFPVPPATTGFYYSVVDMSMSNGLGSVIVSNVFIYGVPSNLTSTAQLHATKHANGVDYWIMIHEHPSNSRAYLFSSGGINPTAVVSSSTGLSYDCNSTGFLKFSPTGQKLCVSVSYAGVELYNFNNNSGLVNNPLTLISNTLEANYFGCAFSADGTKLYAGHNISGSTNSNLIQWDINAGSAQAIHSSSVNIPSNSFYPQVLQLAPNGKIYIATQNSQSLRFYPAVI